MASLHLLPPLSKYCSSLASLPPRHSQRIFSLPSLSFTARTSPFISKSFVVRFALTESDSPKSLEPDPRSLLQEIAVSFYLLHACHFNLWFCIRVSTKIVDFVLYFCDSYVGLHCRTVSSFLRIILRSFLAIFD